MPIRTAITHPQRTAIRQANPARALDLQKEQLNRIIDPGDLKPAALHRVAGQDLTTAQPSALRRAPRAAFCRSGI